MISIFSDIMSHDVDLHLLQIELVEILISLATT